MPLNISIPNVCKDGLHLSHWTPCLLLSVLPATFLSALSCRTSGEPTSCFARQVHTMDTGCEVGLRLPLTSGVFGMSSIDFLRSECVYCILQSLFPIDLPDKDPLCNAHTSNMCDNFRLCKCGLCVSMLGQFPHNDTRPAASL